MFQALLGLYEVSHVHLSWCVSIETKGLTLGSLGRRKIIQLKMYMAVSGRAAERGAPSTKTAPRTHPGPLPTQEVGVGGLPPLSGTRKGPASQHLGMPSELDKGIRGVVRSSLSGTRGLPVPHHHIPCPQCVGGGGGEDFKAASSTSHLLCDCACWHTPSSSLVTVIGAQRQDHASCLLTWTPRVFHPGAPANSDPDPLPPPPLTCQHGLCPVLGSQDPAVVPRMRMQAEALPPFVTD